MALNGGRFNSEKKALPAKVSLVHNEENNVYLAHFASFWSKASGSLGASEPAAGVVKMALERAGGIKTISVPDELSMATLASFAGESALSMRATVSCLQVLRPKQTTINSWLSSRARLHLYQHIIQRYLTRFWTGRMGGGDRWWSLWCVEDSR